MSTAVKPKSSKMPPLSSEEADLLAKNEWTISKGIAAFMDVGAALEEIRDKKLYRKDHKTFDKYCRNRWGIVRSRAYQLIEAAATAKEMSTIGGQIIVENERQARALSGVPSHLRQEVLRRIEDSGESITEQVVTRIVSALLDQRRAAAGDCFASEKEESPPPPRNETPRRLAGEDKPRLYVPRGYENQRLALKDALSAQPKDVATKKAREIVQQTIDLARATAQRWEDLLGEASA